MPAGVELATAFIHVVPSFSGVNSAVAAGFAPAGAIADKAGTEAGKKFSTGFGASVKKTAGVFGLAVGIKALVDGFNGAVDAASHLKEATAAADVVFGQSFDTIDRWARGASRSFGQSNTQALQAAKTFGIFGQAAGLADGENAKFSISLTELASDLASFNDTSPEEAIIALGAALRGENEPIRRFGVLLDDATLRNRALKLGLIETTKDALTPQQKVLAAYAEIMEQTSIQQGDFARTSEGFANQQRTLQSQWEDISAAIGELFLPMMEQVQRGILDNVIPAIQDLVDWLGKLDDEEWFQTVTDIFDEMKAGGELDLVTGGFVETFKRRFGEELPSSLEHGWEQIKQANRDASEELPKAFEDSWNNRWLPAAEHGFQQLGEIFRKGDEDITSAFSHGWEQISDWWNTGWGVNFPAALENGRQQINAGVEWLWELIAGSFSNGWVQITGWWNRLWGDAWATVSSFTGTITRGIVSFVSGMIGNFSSGWTQITSIFSGAVRVITDIVNGVLRTFERVTQGIRDAFRGIGQFIRDAFGPVGDFLSGVAGTFQNLFGGIGDRARYFKGRLSSLAENRKASGFAGGAALARVQSVLGRFPGLRITETLGNRAYDVANGVARSPNSYHYDRNNPAVDVAGPIPQLHAFARLLYAMGGWRQILWQVAGHYDHVHVAHGGGMVESSWPRMWGDGYDERTARLQVGETVLPKGWEPPRVEAWDPHEHDRDDVESMRERAAVEINGDVYTTDIDEFFDEAERRKRRAYALAAPAVG